MGSPLAAPDKTIATPNLAEARELRKWCLTKASHRTLWRTMGAHVHTQGQTTGERRARNVLWFAPPSPPTPPEAPVAKRRQQLRRRNIAATATILVIASIFLGALFLLRLGRQMSASMPASAASSASTSPPSHLESTPIRGAEDSPSLQRGEESEPTPSRPRPTQPRGSRPSTDIFRKPGF